MPSLEFSFASEVFNLAGESITAATVASPIPLNSPIEVAGHTITITHDVDAGAFPFESTVRSIATGRIVASGWHANPNDAFEAAKSTATA